MAGDFVLVGTNNDNPRHPGVRADGGVVMCFSAKDGKFLWQSYHPRIGERQRDMPHMPITSRPSVEDGRCYYMSNNSHVICADLDGFHDSTNDGPMVQEESRDKTSVDIVWDVDLIARHGVYKVDDGGIGNPLSAVEIGDDLVYVVTGNGALRTEVPAPDAPSIVALDKKTGHTVWSNSSFGEDIRFGQWASPVLVRCENPGILNPEVLVFPAGDGYLHGLDPRNGATLWRLPCPPAATAGGRDSPERLFFVATPAVSQGTIFAGLWHRPEVRTPVELPLVAVDVCRPRAPKISWQFIDRDFKGLMAPPAVRGDRVYATSWSRWLFVIDRHSGEPLAKIDLVLQLYFCKTPAYS